MDYTNLRDKTLFDFCDDVKIPKKLGIIGIKTKEEYFSEMKKDVSFNPFILLLYADLVDDMKLYDAVRKQFEEELDCEYGHSIHGDTGYEVIPWICDNCVHQKFKDSGCTILKTMDEVRKNINDNKCQYFKIK